MNTKADLQRLELALNESLRVLNEVIASVQTNPALALALGPLADEVERLNKTYEAMLGRMNEKRKAMATKLTNPENNAPISEGNGGPENRGVSPTPFTYESSSSFSAPVLAGTKSRRRRNRAVRTRRRQSKN